MAMSTLISHVFNSAGIIPTYQGRGAGAMNLGKYQMMMGFFVMYFIMGMFFDSWSMLFLTFPFVMPIITAMGINPIWWGVIYVMAAEQSTITPPFGLSLFVLRSVVPQHTLGTMVRGSLPYLIPIYINIILLIMFPASGSVAAQPAFRKIGGNTIMPKKIIATPGLPNTMGPYSQVVEGIGQRMIFISGQVPQDITGNLAGEDFESQVRQVFSNIRIALENAGSRLSDIAKLTILVTELNPEVYAALAGVRRELFGDQYPASTLMQVSALASPDWLVEIEAYAVL
jgi:enamine deaminase RidA (YjgF/YER057c/UK114 family)